jgi:hypothetical protein
VSNRAEMPNGGLVEPEPAHTGGGKVSVSPIPILSSQIWRMI